MLLVAVLGMDPKTVAQRVERTRSAREEIACDDLGVEEAIRMIGIGVVPPGKLCPPDLVVQESDFVFGGVRQQRRIATRSSNSLWTSE